MKLFPWTTKQAASAVEDRQSSLPDFEYLRLHSVHGDVVRASRAEGLLINDPPQPSPGAIDVVFIRLPALPCIALAAAVAPTPIGLRIEPDRLHAPVLSFRTRRQGPADTLVLRHPLADHYAAAIPKTYGLSRPLRLDRPAVGDWEIYRHAPAEAPVEFAPVVAAALGSVRPMLAARLSTDSILAWLSEASVEQLATIGQAILRLASPDTLAAVGALIVRAGLAERIAAAWPDDPFASAALPALTAWNRARPIRAAVPVGTDLDMLADAVALGRPATDLPLHLLAVARRRVEPSRGVAIIATARNEGPFFLDWIAHHRALGVEHFFIYSSDDNDDCSDDLLDRLAEHGVITFLRNSVGPSVSRQRKAYNHAFLGLPDLLDFRWTATIDLDEYLMVDPSQFSTLGDFLELQESRGADAVSLNWLMYGPERQTTFHDRPFAERLLFRRPVPNRHVKTIVRTNQVWGTLHHAPIWPDRVTALALDALGKPHYSPGLIGGIGAFRDAPDTGPAWVNHYFLRSLPEIVLKYARSSADAGGTHELRFNPSFVPGLLEDMRLDLVEDRTILAFSDAVSAERDTLRSLPGVALAHQACVEALCSAADRLVRDIPAHASELPDHVRDDYLSLVDESIAGGVASP